MLDIKPPKNLSTEAQREWLKIQKEYGIEDAAGLLTLNTGFGNFDTFRATEKVIKKEGLMITDRFGQSKPHPLCNVLRDSRAAFLQALKMLNLDILPLRDKPGRPGS